MFNIGMITVASLLAATFSASSAASPAAAAFERPSDADLQAAQAQEPPRLNALAAWNQLPAALKASLTMQLAALDNAQRVEFFSPPSSWRQLYAQEKLVLLDQIAQVTPLPNVSPVAAYKPAIRATFAGWMLFRPLGCLPSWNVTFDASGSNDPDGRIISYTWSWTGFQNGKTISTTPQPVIQLVGNRFRYDISLTVTDNLGAANSVRIVYFTPLREEQPPTTC